jgi:gluconate 2-dehydrogenase gamma chain
MSELSRRELLKNVAIAITVGGIDSAAAQHVHAMAADDKAAAGGVYKPKAFTPHEYKTIQRLSELIVPADDKSKSGIDAGAPEFIDLLSSQNEELKDIYTGGIGWLDHQMMKRHQTDWVSASPDQQTAMLDIIAYRKNNTPELGPGIYFFDWARRMIVDAYWTSPLGFKDIGYIGNTGVAKFEVPAASLDYALKRSGL